VKQLNRMAILSRENQQNQLLAAGVIESRNGGSMAKTEIWRKSPGETAYEMASQNGWPKYHRRRRWREIGQLAKMSAMAKMKRLHLRNGSNQKKKRRK